MFLSLGLKLVWFLGLWIVKEFQIYGNKLVQLIVKLFVLFYYRKFGIPTLSTTLKTKLIFVNVCQYTKHLAQFVVRSTIRTIHWNVRDL